MVVNLQVQQQNTVSFKSFASVFCIENNKHHPAPSFTSLPELLTIIVEEEDNYDKFIATSTTTNNVTEEDDNGKVKNIGSDNGNKNNGEAGMESKYDILLLFLTLHHFLNIFTFHHRTI